MDISTLTDQVYQTLRKQILEGTYKPGQKLNLAQLARDLDVSNTPIREAMVRLERLGLVEIVPYCGPKVKRLTAAQLIDICDVRIALEALAAQQVAQSKDPDVLTGIEKVLEMYEYACNRDDPDPQAIMDADRAFHDALVRASANSVLLEMLPNLSDRTWLLIKLNTPPSEGVDRTRAFHGLQSHKRVFNALQQGDQEAAVQATRRHLTNVKEELVEQMSKLETA